MSHIPTDDTDKAFLRGAVQHAIESVDDGGDPFGAVVVHNGKVIAGAGNRAQLDCDPTAHAEIAAIREAGKVLANAHLPEATLYTSCEPCPMCLAGKTRAATLLMAKEKPGQRFETADSMASLR